MSANVSGAEEDAVMTGAEIDCVTPKRKNLTTMGQERCDKAIDCDGRLAYCEGDPGHSGPHLGRTRAVSERVKTRRHGLPLLFERIRRQHPDAELSAQVDAAETEYLRATYETALRDIMKLLGDSKEMGKPDLSLAWIMARDALEGKS